MATPIRFTAFFIPFHITTKIVNSEMWFNTEKVVKSTDRNFGTNMSVRDFVSIERRKVIRFCKNLIGYMKQKYGFLITHFVLMDTHYHMIAECTNRKYPLNRCMQTFNMMFARWINRMTGRQGALFAKRYSSNAIMEETYGKILLGYFYANPVKAGISLKPEFHDCTSYRQYVFGRDVLTADEVKVDENCRILAGLTADSSKYGETLKELVSGYMEDRLEVRVKDFKQMLKSQVLISSTGFKKLSAYRKRKIRQSVSILFKLWKKEEKEAHAQIV